MLIVNGLWRYIDFITMTMGSGICEFFALH